MKRQYTIQFDADGHPQRINDFAVPKWWACQWRRIACQKRNCRLCGQIIRDRKRHIAKGEDPDSWEAVFDDVHRNFQSTIKLMKKGAKKWEINWRDIEQGNGKIQEPPSPSRFPLYRAVRDWMERVLDTAFILRQEYEGMTFDAFEDLTWYATLLPKKVYRQLCTRWEMKRGDKHGDIDYAYTRYVLGECFKILKASLGQLAVVSKAQNAELMLLLSKLGMLEPKIMKG